MLALTHEEVLALPLEDLAYRVLADAQDSNAWNSHNWLNEHAQFAGYASNPAALRALAEAWGWMRSRGLVERDPGQSSETAIFVTRRGHEVLDKGLAWLRTTERLDVDLVPDLEVDARPHFMRGDLDMAVFAAMRRVEIRLREAAGESDSLVGTKLAQQAFRAGGPLHDEGMDAGEAVALMDLFKGALGLFKNPSSHRDVDYGDANEAAEVVLLADLLLRMLARHTEALRSARGG